MCPCVKFQYISGTHGLFNLFSATIRFNAGDGSDATIRYMLVDTIQIVWTHNCEHGVINGFDVTVVNDQNEPSLVDGSGAIVEVGSIFNIGNEYVQCGPEQVLAKIPALKHDEKDALASLVRFVPLEEVITE